MGVFHFCGKYYSSSFLILNIALSMPERNFGLLITTIFM